MASRIIDHHPLTPALGEGSPLHRLYDLDASVLLLGVDHANNTSLHLAEYRATWPSKHTYTEGVPMMVDGTRRWVQFEDLAIDADDFATIGEAFAATGHERQGPVGAGVGRHFSMRAAVDFAVDWMSTHRR
jgi:aminoglycoside 3-N-acetyltransferase